MGIFLTFQEISVYEKIKIISARDFTESLPHEAPGVKIKEASFRATPETTKNSWHCRGEIVARYDNLFQRRRPGRNATTKTENFESTL
jgi:hypothetical protein